MDGRPAWPANHWHHATRISVGHLHYARSAPISVQCRRVSRPYLQAISRRAGARDVGPDGTATKTIWLDPRACLPFGKRALRCRTFELARAETHPASVGLVI